MEARVQNLRSSRVARLLYSLVNTTRSLPPVQTIENDPCRSANMAREAGRAMYVEGEDVTRSHQLKMHTVNVDVDWMDPTYSKNLPIKPNDQTSNNLWVNQQMSHPENKDMVLQVCKDLKSEGWKAAYTRIVSCVDKNKRAVLMIVTTAGCQHVQEQHR